MSKIGIYGKGEKFLKQGAVNGKIIGVQYADGIYKWKERGWNEKE